jgi:hypothetical protein
MHTRTYMHTRTHTHSLSLYSARVLSLPSPPPPPPGFVTLRADLTSLFFGVVRREKKGRVTTILKRLKDLCFPNLDLEKYHCWKAQKEEPKEGADRQEGEAAESRNLRARGQDGRTAPVSGLPSLCKHL